MHRENLFDSLVRNAIDFLNRAIDELQENPKYSVVHFFAAIEIFLKARLLLEHWSLVHEEPGRANLTSFFQGDFRSVSLQEAIRRLKNVAGTRISADAERSFERLQDHRNKLIHFFHPEYGPDAAPSVLASVVADECVAWLHLHKMLTHLWANEFENYDRDINALNYQMLRLRAFLQVRYDALRDDIERGKERGVLFIECPSCGFEAARYTEQVGCLSETTCIVCENMIRRLDTPRPDCEATIAVYDLGEAVCEDCETSINMDYLIDVYGVHQTPEEALESPAHAYCPNCEWIEQPSVVPHNNHYFCLNCLAVYDYIGSCEWCGELNAGDMSDSFLTGCIWCEGRLGWGD